MQYYATGSQKESPRLRTVNSGRRVVQSDHIPVVNDSRIDAVINKELMTFDKIPDLQCSLDYDDPDWNPKPKTVSTKTR